MSAVTLVSAIYSLAMIMAATPTRGTESSLVLDMTARTRLTNIHFWLYRSKRERNAEMESSREAQTKQEPRIEACSEPGVAAYAHMKSLLRAAMARPSPAPA